MATTKKVVKMKDSVLEKKVAETITTKSEVKEEVISEATMISTLLHSHNAYQEYVKAQNEKAVADSDKKWFKFASRDQATRYIQELGTTKYTALNNAIKVLREHERALNNYVWEEYRGTRHNNLDKTEDREYIKKMENELAVMKSMLNQFLKPTLTAARAAREETEQESE
jgi:polyribonucleotide nucleotidyltransferase